MKIKRIMYAAMGLALCGMGFAATSTLATATQTVNMSIVSSSTLITSGNPGTMSITLNSSGVGTATDATTTYTVNSNSGSSGTLKITGQITSGGNMPTNTTLSVNLASKSGTSAGAQSLISTAPVDLVTALPTLVSDTGAITYTFNITNGWAVSAQSLSRTVTLTLLSSS